MQTILGANGTIGSLLAKELPAYTSQIRLVSRNPKKVNDSDDLYPADLSDVSMVEKAIIGSEVVYLLVGFDYNIKTWQDKWPRLMRATIDACIKHNAKLVFFDNVYMYDKKAIPNMTEESPLNPCSKKGMVRHEIAEMLMKDVKSGKLQGLIARSADFYGPNNDKSFVTEVVYKNLKKGKTANWFINPNFKHSLTYTPDAAKATALLGNTAEAYNQVWHLPTYKQPLTGKEIVSHFAKAMNAKDKVSALPTWLLKALGLFIPIMKELPEMMYQYEQDYIFDSSKFDKKFNFNTTSYTEGIRQTVAKTIL